MCGRFGGNLHVWWFWPKECNIDPFNGDPAICGPVDHISVAVLDNVWPTGHFDRKACDHFGYGCFGLVATGFMAILGVAIWEWNYFD